MEQQKKSNFKEKLLNAKQNIFSLIKKVLLKVKKALVFVFKKIKQVVLFLFSKIEPFFKKLWQKVKFFSKKLWVKVKVLLKKISIHYKKVPIITKLVTLLILIITISTVSVYFQVAHQKATNLYSYVLLQETLDYKLGVVFEQEFITSSYVSQQEQDEANKYYILFNAIENNYVYYLNELRKIKNANNNLRQIINDGLTYIQQKVLAMTNDYRIILLEAALDEPDDNFIITKHEQVLNYMKDFVNYSNYLLPQIENYIALYGNEVIQNKLLVYLTKLQFHYASAIISHDGLGNNVDMQLNDLNNIIQKFKLFTGTSNSIYKQDFINAYEVYSAYNYYKATDKFIYKSRNDLSQDEKTYAQAFYNFLMQASYN